MSRQAWESALKAMEDDLDAQEEALRTGNVTEVPAFIEPGDLGELPTDLAGRVTNLIQRTGLLATFVQYQLVATDADLRFERRETKHAGAQALYLDRAV
ncbi:hypothetical protein [Austwickia chelonae]|uniref:hypothetical protein n=1 Tax=Austwickia chelonae TaxID=100225 RepID=UPI000E23F736|nr:hypothetical protein [Austwickia chelonae]